MKGNEDKREVNVSEKVRATQNQSKSQSKLKPSNVCSEPSKDPTHVLSAGNTDQND